MANRSLKKIALMLSGLVLLPAAFYTIYEIASLNDREKLLQAIYRQQLDTILFSVNQYSWDVANSWATRLSSFHEINSLQPQDSALGGYLNANPAIDALYLFRAAGNGSLQLYQSPNADLAPELPRAVETALGSRGELLRRLERYQRSGYRKLEPLPLDVGDRFRGQHVLLLFPLPSTTAQPQMRFGAILVNPARFIDSVLLDKLSEISAERFYLTVFSGDSLISTTPPVVAAEAEGAFQQRRAIWLFPDYQLGIRLQGTSVEALARARYVRNLWLIAAVSLLLLAGLWMIFRSIRREIQLAQLKSDFVSNISHELRTPLSLIRMFAETLEMKRVPTEEKKQEYYRIIGQETERLTHLVNNILNFSKIEAGKKKYHFQPVSLTNLVRDVLEKYHFQLQQQGFSIETELDEELPDISADRDALSETLINLIDNAIKYSPEQKEIGLRTGRVDSQVYVEITDRGMGIPAEHQQAVFEKFYRVSGGLVHNTKGSGLGLSLVKHIVDSHGGKIVLKSQPGRGSRFRLLFPAGPANGNGAIS